MQLLPISWQKLELGYKLHAHNCLCGIGKCHMKRNAQHDKQSLCWPRCGWRKINFNLRVTKRIVCVALSNTNFFFPQFSEHNVLTGKQSGQIWYLAILNKESLWAHVAMQQRSRESIPNYYGGAWGKGNSMPINCQQVWFSVTHGLLPVLCVCQKAHLHPDSCIQGFGSTSCKVQ